MGSVSLINGHIDDDTPRITPQEAIEFINNEVQIDIRFCTIAEVAKTQEAFNLAISALEKQIPKKPIQANQLGFYWCPNCTSAIKKRIEHSVRIIANCPFCGQVLDWSNTE